MGDRGKRPERQEAEDLLEGLVRVRSLSGEEGEASAWLVERMRELGFERAEVDAAGNAVGELGDPGGRLVVLLGHVDTVDGEVPVRREPSGDDNAEVLLYGRGTVDAKGPLATFVCGAARFGAEAARAQGLRVVVAGAVEEEAATSKGARFLARRFDGESEPVPDACVIGEPSRWDRVTLGYKGRFLCELEAQREMAHTAGPDPGVTVVAVALWNALQGLASRFNAEVGTERAFDQLLPSLRGIWTESDGLIEKVRAVMGARLPLDFDVEAVVARMGQVLEDHAGATTQRPETATHAEGGFQLLAVGPSLEAKLRFYGTEVAWRGDKRGRLPAAFLSAIREIGGEAAQPGFVVKTGTSDMNVVAPVWRCPILAYGPGDSSLDHTPNEHVSLAEFWRAVRVVEGVLGRL